ncbi:MAG: hypothetical protein PVH03_10010 [Chloroflexota bacterium]|jgi:hypothetical protein
MFGIQLKRVPSIWIFLVGLVLLSLACQSVIRLLNQDSESLQIAETAPVDDQTSGEINSIESEAEAMVAESEPNSRYDAISPHQIQKEIVTDLTILKQGYRQDEGELAYAFLVHNPNPELTIADSEYQVIAYDKSGRAVLTDSEHISFILPGQSLGITGNLYVEEDVLIDDLEVHVQTGKPHFDQAIPALEVQAVEYRPGEYYDRVTGLIAGPKSHDIEDLRVSAIAYDNAGKIVGAGYSFVSFIKAGTVTGVDVTITNDGIVDRVELFPRLSFSIIDTEAEDRSKNVWELSLVRTDFIQNNLRVGYGFLLENPSQTHAAEDSEYRMTAFNSAGRVILVDEGYVDRLMPGQTFGFGSTFFVEEREEVDSIELQLKTRSFRRSELFPELEFDRVKIEGDEYSRIVSGEIMNRHEQDFEDIRVSAIVFDANDQIIGGGFNWLDIIPAGESSTVDIWVTSVGEPVSAQLYTTIGDQMEIE